MDPPDNLPPPRRRGAQAWVAGIAGRRGAVVRPDRLAQMAGDAREVLHRWALSEVAPGRLVPWLPVAFGFGIVLYFTAAQEPALWAAIALTAVFVAATVLSRHRPVAFPAALALAAMAAGFATATAKTALIRHPVLLFPASSVAVSGFVEMREERERTDRIVVAVRRIEGARITDKPDRVRVSVRKGTAPAVGAFVEFKARLSPPLAPLRPGGYDFARDMYFQQIGASGYVLGAVRPAAAPAQPGYWLRYATFIDGMRDYIDKRIRAVLPGDKGSIASALITGKRDAISVPVNDAMYVSSLAHVLSISGYHMAVVAGIVFFFVRASLALMPSAASRHPIKKWAALAALLAAAFYLLLSGAEVATQRSFIMIAIVLIGVMIDRPALTFRTLSVAAFGVLLLAPQSVVHPSFQMSFAATLALVAIYQYGLPWRANADTSLGARIALWGGREIAGLILASLVAGFATTLYAAFHFHRLAPYGVIANLLAMPVVSVWVMPAGILGVLAMPFGFDGFFWQMMGWGLDWMIAVALWVTSLPGSVGRMHAFGVGPLLLGTAGLIVACLLRTPLRLAGALLLVVATVWAVRTPRPDVLIAADGQSVAARGPDGRLAVMRTASDSFAVKEWLNADADPRGVKDPSLRAGVRCDDAGCIGRLPDGRLIAVPLLPEAFEEDCARAAVVVSARDNPLDCAALAIDRKVWRQTGATALRWTGDGFETSVSRPAGYDRPWSRPPPLSATADGGSARDTVRQPPRDATPRADDLEPGG